MSPPEAARFISRPPADTMMKRPAQPEEIAPAYVFLAAPAMSSIRDSAEPLKD